MLDMEKIMSWLEGLAEPDWRECYSDSEVQETARQALDLIDELLKEQEPIEPEMVIDGLGERYRCKCGAFLFKFGNYSWGYCPYCGKKMKWE